MRKLYRTKNAMIYIQPLMVGELKLLVEQHRKKYGQDPKRIYLSSEEWDRYESEYSAELRQLFAEQGYPKFQFGGMEFFAMTFRGIPVVKINDWRMLARKK